MATVINFDDNGNAEVPKADQPAPEHRKQEESYVREAPDAEKVAATADPEDALWLEVRDQKFRVKDDVPTHLGMKIAAAANDEDIVAICGKWAPMILTAEDEPRFDRFMIQADPVIHDTEYMEMFTQLMELVGGRPTNR